MILQILFIISLAFSAPIKSSPESMSEQVLKNHLKNQDVVAIKKMGPPGYLSLRKIMMTDTESVDHRWNAVIGLARIGGAESLSDIEYASKSSTWYLRSAAILAHGLIDQDRGMAYAKKALHHDPALLVRAAALHLIAQKPTLDREFLWAQLYNPINFKNGQSLSIRLSLLKVLSSQARKSEQAKFLALSREGDEAIRTEAMKVLQKSVALRQ